MPFGLTTAPSVYQSINNVLASLMRQYLIPNVLYIGLLVKPRMLITKKVLGVKVSTNNPFTRRSLYSM